MKFRTCVCPAGCFQYGVHRPSYVVRNLRNNDFFMGLGIRTDGKEHINDRNFPESDVTVPEADWIYEIPNPFPFRGTTYIARRWAEGKVEDPSRIRLPEPSSVSFSAFIVKRLGSEAAAEEQMQTVFADLPETLLLAIAETSTDPKDLIGLARYCCDFLLDPDTDQPTGLYYTADTKGRYRARIRHHALFELLVNNPYLPDDYKVAMVLKPGVQGDSEIVGEWDEGDAGVHVFEYLRTNSYIPWGHYASNMAHDAVRYRALDLTEKDMRGMRHLYYQRNYVRLAQALDLPLPPSRKTLSGSDLEKIRKLVLEKISTGHGPSSLRHAASLWGWNYGFDFAPSGYRLHASHQQIHQQFALIPGPADLENSTALPSVGKGFETYCCGDLIDAFIEAYHEKNGRLFFDDYEQAIQTNRRMDGRDDLPSSLVVYEDEQVMLFVPKAQTSQWELQLMPKKAIGNILEADPQFRASLDKGILVALRVLTAMGARMVTTIEFSKRFDRPVLLGQRLLYSFLPKLPESPGAFSEAQLRFINGHYPEDFARACRLFFANERKTVDTGAKGKA